MHALSGPFCNINWQISFLTDVRVFNPLAASNCCQLLRSHVREKRRTYEQHAHEIERASFTPLVFSALGGMS